MDLAQQVLRASSEVFASALRDSTGRGDEAVAKRERTSAYLEQCEASLRARDDELAQSQRELRELRAVRRRVGGCGEGGEEGHVLGPDVGEGRVGAPG